MFHPSPGQQLQNGAIVIAYHNSGVILAMLPTNIHTPYVCWLVGYEENTYHTFAGNYYQAIDGAVDNYKDRVLGAWQTLKA